MRKVAKEGMRIRLIELNNRLRKLSRLIEFGRRAYQRNKGCVVARKAIVVVVPL